MHRAIQRREAEFQRRIAQLAEENADLTRRYLAAVLWAEEAYGPGGFAKLLNETRTKRVTLPKEFAKGDDVEGSCRVALLFRARGVERDVKVEDGDSQEEKLEGLSREYEVGVVRKPVMQASLSRSVEGLREVYDVFFS